MSASTRPSTVGQAPRRLEGLNSLEGRDKVTGAARYAVEYPVEGVAHAWAVTSSVAKGRITHVDAEAALAAPGALAVLWYENAPRLCSQEDPELFLLQKPEIAYRGQIVALAVASTLEAAREAAELVRLEYEAQPHNAVLTPDDPGLYAPEKVNPQFATDTAVGDFDAGYAAAAVRIDSTYRTPAYHNNPMEPHATTAQWTADGLTVHDSNQGSSVVQQTLATLFGVPPEVVRVVSEHAGGGFGAEGESRCAVVLAALAARRVGRPVRLALTRQQMFAAVGYRTPTIQRIRLGADPHGRLTAICHDAIGQTSTIKEFAEQTAVYTRTMYAAPHRRTTHRMVRLDVPTPTRMWAPGECPGAFALESAMDELAVACGIDPIELRIRNEPAVDPEEQIPFSSRNLVACLREGAQRFGWADRDPASGVRRRGRWLTGTGVAGSAYPAASRPSTASAHARAGGSYQGRYARYAFGAQFAEVRVDIDSGEVRVGRLLGVFAAGRIVNPTTARSQLIGGMTMGLSMALHEEGLLDPRFGDWVNHDLATYHFAACADIELIEACWIDEHDPHGNPLGTKGIGEIGIAGTAAAIANAVHHATGLRVRDLPVRLDKMLARDLPRAAAHRRAVREAGQVVGATMPYSWIFR